MKKDKTIEEIIAGLQAVKPALEQQEAAELTSRIVSGISQTKQQVSGRSKVIIVARWITAAAASFLIGVFVYQQLNVLSGTSSAIIRNPYLKELAFAKESGPKPDSLGELIDSYVRREKKRMLTTIFKEQYIHLATKQ